VGTAGPPRGGRGTQSAGLRESPDPGGAPGAHCGGRRPRPGRSGQFACAAGFSHVAVDQGRGSRSSSGDLRRPARRSRATAGRPARPQPLDQGGTGGDPRPSGTGPTRRWPTCGDQSQRIPRCLLHLAGRPGQRRVAGGGAVIGGRRRWPCGQVGGAPPGPAGPPIVLAAICAVIASAAPAIRKLVLPLVSSNRFERHLVNYVGALAQLALATVRDRRKKLRRAGRSHLDRG